MVLTALPAPLDLVPPLVRSLSVTLELTAGAAAVAVVASLAAGLARLSRHALPRALATVYVETFRGTSALVQLFWFYFALPLVGIELAALPTGIVVLGLNAGAYGAEVVRGAVRAVPREQAEAALSLGFSRGQALRRVVLPQALLAILPPAGNLLVELLKNTALASLITLNELTFTGQVLRAATLRTAEIFGIVLLLYYGVAQVALHGMRRLERRLAHGQDHGGAS